LCQKYAKNNCNYDKISSMVDKIVEFLIKIIGNEKLITFIVSMIPLIELKGAIPIGIKLNNSLFCSFFLSYFGSTLIFIPVFFLLIPIFNLLKKIKFIKNLVLKIETYLTNKAEKLVSKNKNLNVDSKTHFLKKALLIFVGVPFPVTGVYTGTAIAVFLDMEFKDTILSIVLGNLISGSIITLLTYFFKDYVDIIIYILFFIAIIMFVIMIIKILKADAKDNI